MTQTLDVNQLKSLRKSDISAFKYLVLPFLFCLFMIFTLDESLWTYMLGQVFGAIFFAQAFILLHETGHRSFFKTNSLNTLFGHFFSFLVFIPYYNWLEIHDLHHKWTGWRDKDPTTEKTFADRFSGKQEKIINTCWKYYIPLFTIGYRFGIYWKAEKLKRHLPEKNYKRCLLEMYLYAAFYLITIVLFPKFYLLILPALYISFIITDHISLSQHSHIKMPVSEGKDVEPLKFKDQAQYSRSLIFPKVISEYFLFNFNHHEAHHVYPGLPCYMLDKMNGDYYNSYQVLPWLKRVKSMSGVDFIFRSSSDRKDF
ncbi:MAG: fatty acid desaturase [Bacteriovoracaceae bacterium]|nr:fatty acid desaturase [Bacteriovoracaceae bacterium]